MGGYVGRILVLIWDGCADRAWVDCGGRSGGVSADPAVLQDACGEDGPGGAFAEGAVEGRNPRKKPYFIHFLRGFRIKQFQCNKGLKQLPHDLLQQRFIAVHHIIHHIVA